MTGTIENLAPATVLDKTRINGSWDTTGWTTDRVQTTDRGQRVKRKLQTV